MSIIANIQRLINKVSMALKVKGLMPLINQNQFYGDDGPFTQYVIHYGHPHLSSKKNDVVDVVYGKVALLKVLVEILESGGADG